MAYTGQDDEQQALLQQQLGGTPLNTTMPVGQPAKMEAGNYAAGPADHASLVNAMGFNTTEQGGGGGQSARDALGGYAGGGALTGFNTSDYGGDVKGRNSMKNTFGRIASRYKNAPSSIDSIMADPDFQRHFAGAQKVQGGAGDKIDFGGMLSDFESGTPVGVVDVLTASDPNNDSAGAWAWQDEANDGGGAMPAQGGGMDPMAMLGGQGNSLDALGESDVLAQILKELQGAQGGDEGQALLQSLMGGQ